MERGRQTTVEWTEPAVLIISVTTSSESELKPLIMKLHEVPYRSTFHAVTTKCLTLNDLEMP